MKGCAASLKTVEIGPDRDI